MLPKFRRPTHPGKILDEEFLKPLNISQAAFVAHLGGSWTQPKLSAIINGKRAVTEAIALDFADALGTSPQFWINLQNDVNLWDSMQVHKKIALLPLLSFGRKKSDQVKKRSSNLMTRKSVS